MAIKITLSWNMVAVGPKAALSFGAELTAATGVTFCSSGALDEEVS